MEKCSITIKTEMQEGLLLLKNNPFSKMREKKSINGDIRVVITGYIENCLL